MAYHGSTKGYHGNTMAIPRHTMAIPWHTMGYQLQTMQYQIMLCHTTPWHPTMAGVPCHLEDRNQDGRISGRAGERILLAPSEEQGPPSPPPLHVMDKAKHSDTFQANAVVI